MYECAEEADMDNFGTNDGGARGADYQISALTVSGEPQTGGSRRGGTRSFYFQWHIVERCNLRCRHCYQNSHQAGELGETDLQKIACLLESALIQWRYSGRVSLTGGEPFLVPGTLFRLLKFFEDSPSFEWVGILTNGTQIDRSTAERLSRLRKLREVQVSLDGDQATHDSIRGPGSYRRTLDGIAELRGAGVKTAIMFTLTKQNAGSATSMIDLATELGVDAVTVERASPIGPKCGGDDLLSADEIREIYTTIAQRKRGLGNGSGTRIRTSRPLWCLADQKLGGFCPAGFGCLAILHDGTVLPCRRLEIPVGNILRDGLYRIWYTSPVLWKLRNRKLLSGECGNCEFQGGCGGCRAIAHAMTGDFMAEDPQCWKSLAQAGGAV